MEPFYDNIIRIHKAAKLENLQDKITLITNAISNQRYEIKSLSRNDVNIGGQSLFGNQEKVFTKEDMKTNRYLVETIFFDDIVPYIPKKEGKYKYKKAIMKIDIEGSEPFAFQHAQILFDTLEIVIIQMEWGYLLNKGNNNGIIESLIDFLMSRKLIPYANYDRLRLSKKNWHSWPWDIVWIKEGY